MSLYDKPASPPPRALAMPRRWLENAVRDIDMQTESLFRNNNPAPKLAELGTKGAEVMADIATRKAFLETLRPGCTATAAAKRVKPVTSHPDGTVTLT
jgi:hypothetical protein